MNTKTPDQAVEAPCLYPFVRAMLRLTQLATAAGLVVNALAAGAPVMNADDCNATDPNQLWRVNAAHGAASHQLTVTVGGADFCAATSAAGDCSVSDFAFVNSTECAPATCAFAQGFDVIDKVTKQPAPKGQECAKCLVRSKLNSSLCFGVGAMLGSADWKVSAADATGLQTFEMLETDPPICLGSGLGPQGPFGPPYPISLQECEYDPKERSARPVLIRTSPKRAD